MNFNESFYSILNKNRSNQHL